MTTIYVVSTGDYSDYHILGVCSTKEKAVTLQTATGADHLEEWPLDELADMAAKGFREWRVQMQRDGTVIECRCSALSERTDLRDYAGPGNNVRFYCNAKSQDHAVKIANERRAQMIANNEWSE